MKRILLLIFMLCSIHLFADTVTEALIGYGRAEDIDKGGMSASFTFYKDFNYMFALGINPAVSWFQWDRPVLNDNGEVIEETKIVGDSEVTVTKKTKANAFLFPVLVVAKVQYPVTKSIIPFVNGGLGYSIMPLSYDDENNEAQTDVYQGFSWKIGSGIAFRVQDIPDFRFIAEVSYRNIPVSDSDDFELSMSGFAFMLGIQYGKIAEKGGSPSRLGGW